MHNETQVEPEHRRPEEGIYRVLSAGALPLVTSHIDLVVAPAPAGWRVTASYYVEVVDPSRGGYLLLDHASCPLPIIEIEAAAGHVRDLWADLQQRLYLIEITPVAKQPMIAARVTMDWRPEHVEAGLSVRYLVAPDHLPRVVTGGIGETMQRQPFIRFCEALPAQLERAGVLRDGSRWTSAHDSYLQIVLLPSAEISALDDDRILLGGNAARNATARVRARISEELRHILTFLSNQTGVRPTVRVAAIADTRSRELSRPFGALLIADPKGFGIGSNDFAILRAQGVSRAAHIWWGAGVRMHGPWAAIVNLALSRALTLWRLRCDRIEAHLDTMLTVTRELAEGALSENASRDERDARLAAEMGLRLFSEMERGPAALEELRAMTHEYWGHEVSAEQVLRRLAAVGVRLPPRRSRASRGAGARWRLRRRRNAIVRWIASRSLAGSASHSIHGVAVHMDPDTAPRDRELTSRLRSAIDLIKTVDPPHFRRLVNDECHVLILEGAYAHYSPRANVITIGPRLLSEPAEVVAATLIHEATHARVSKWVSQQGRVRLRVERLCLREELLFYERLAAAGHVREIVSHLARWKHEYVHPLPTRTQKLARLEEYLQAHQVPRWARVLTGAVARVTVR